MGAVDLVIQVESPKSVARGLQRIGRAGHELGAVSKGRIFPKFRADLLESAVVARAMREGEIEETVIPRNPLDVLAQQIVAITVDEEIERRRPARARQTRVSVPRPLAGAARERARHARRPLPVRRVRRAAAAHHLGSHRRARARARRRAAARGHERGHDPGPRPVRRLPRRRRRPGRRARRGDGLRGPRRPDVPARRVDLADRGDHPRPGARARRRRACRARCRSGRAKESAGPYELGQKIGAASRELVGAVRRNRPASGCAASTTSTSARRATCSPSCASSKTRPARVPTDRTIVVERFRDEIGDWRVCILTPFGSRVHAPWAMAIDGPAPRGARRRGAVDLVGRRHRAALPRGRSCRRRSRPASLDPDEVEDLVVAEVGETALFGARFRENAGRALLIPRRRPGERTPLWQQRLKAQSLLQVARQYGSFPIILETYRECLQDVFDLPALRELLQGICRRASSTWSRSRRRARRRTRRRCSSTTSRTYMYEDDTPPAERRAQALSLDRDLLRELLGQEELRDLLDADAVDEVERQLRGTPTSPDQLHDRLRIRGDLRADEYDAALAEPLLARASRGARPHRGRGAPDRGRGRRPLSRRARGDAAVGPAGRVPRGRPRLAAPARCCASRRAVGRSRPARRTCASAATSASCSPVSSATSCSFAASFAPVAASASGATRTCSGGSGVRRSPRCDARSSRSTRRRSRGSCPAGTGSTGARRCARRWCRCRRCRCRSRSGSRRYCPGAFPATGRSTSMRSRASGEVVWVGAGPDRVAVYFREDAAALGQVPHAARPEGAEHDAIRRRSARGALFWLDLLEETALEESIALPALWDLVWAGEVTNDAWTPLRATRRFGQPQGERRPRRFSRRRSQGATATAGRWSPTARLFVGPAGSPRARGAAARAAGDRDARRGSRRRDSRRLRRGLRGATRARDARPLPPRVLRRGSRRRAVRARRRASSGCGSCAIGRSTPEALVLAAADPAQPYGAGLPWPHRAGARAARVAGAYVGLARRRARSLCRARRPVARAASRPGSRLAPSGARRARRAREGGSGAQACGRALRRRAGRRDRGARAARRGRLPRRAAPGRPTRVDVRRSRRWLRPREGSVRAGPKVESVRVTGRPRRGTDRCGQVVDLRVRRRRDRVPTHESVHEPSRTAAGERARDRGFAAGCDRAAVRFARPCLRREQKARADLRRGCARSDRRHDAVSVRDPAGRDERQVDGGGHRSHELEQRTYRSSASLQVPRCPPASAPCTTRTSARAACRGPRLRNARHRQPHLRAGRAHTLERVVARAAEGERDHRGPTAPSATASFSSNQSSS